VTFSAQERRVLALSDKLDGLSSVPGPRDPRPDRRKVEAKAPTFSGAELRLLKLTDKSDEHLCTRCGINEHAPDKIFCGACWVASGLWRKAFNQKQNVKVRLGLIWERVRKLRNADGVCCLCNAMDHAATCDAVRLEKLITEVITNVEAW
jgi:hypothetical protein